MTGAEWVTSEDPAAMLRFLRMGPGGAAGLLDCPVSSRKLRLLHSATDRIDLSFAPPTQDDAELEERRLILAKCDAIDRYADGLCSAADVMRTRYPDRVWDEGMRVEDGHGVLMRSLSAPGEWLPGAGKRMADAVREIVGNPWQASVVLPRDTVLKHGANNYKQKNVVLSDWLTSTVLSLAEAAYLERGCPSCMETGRCSRYNRVRRHRLKDGPCPRCGGSGQIGTLDSVRLAILADALEEAGCFAESPRTVSLRAFFVCPRCEDQPDRRVHRRSGQAFDHMLRCGRCSFFWEPGTDVVVDRGAEQTMHPIVAHLRSAGPHVRGCWVLDLVLGKI